MGKTVKHPKTYIVSCRVSDRELEFIQRLAQDAGTNISNLLRRRLDLMEADQSRTGSLEV